MIRSSLTDSAPRRRVTDDIAATLDRYTAACREADVVLIDEATLEALLAAVQAYTPNEAADFENYPSDPYTDPANQ